MNPLWWWRLDKLPIIWIVEDDASTQRLVAEHLKVRGFRPVLFDTAEKAYAAMRVGLSGESPEPPPALIILDMLLPGMSGVDLIRLLKQNKAWGKIPVVVVTVLSRKDSLSVEADAEGAFWVNKPFDAGHLMSTIEDVLASVAQGRKQS